MPKYSIGGKLKLSTPLLDAIIFSRQQATVAVTVTGNNITWITYQQMATTFQWPFILKAVVF